MDAVSIFIVGLALTIFLALLAIGYLQSHLKAILTDLCGTRERAAFWTAFSNVTLFFTPLIFALRFQPGNGSATVLVYGLSDQIAGALLGFVAAVVVLGFVIGRFIARENGTSSAAGGYESIAIGFHRNSFRPALLGKLIGNRTLQA